LPSLKFSEKSWADDVPAQARIAQPVTTKDFPANDSFIVFKDFWLTDWDFFPAIGADFQGLFQFSFSFEAAWA
jgi:hypothetical protein